MDSIEAHENMLRRQEEGEAADNHNLKLAHDLEVQKVEAFQALVAVVRNVEGRLGLINSNLIGIHEALSEVNLNVSIGDGEKEL